MSREIETRVVEMEFRYESFKRGILDATHMLELLKKSLNFNDATNSLNELVKITKNFNTDQMVRELDQLSQAKKGLNFDSLASSALKGLTVITDGLGKVATNGFDVAATSLASLKQKIEFTKEEKEFNRLSEAVYDVNLDFISDSLDYIAQRVSTVDRLFDQMFMTTITNGISKVKELINSMSIDQVTAGWEKYGEKTASVQTIMNATGLSIAEVNDVLAELMWFSDETSYGFTDMTTALGMMASSGGDVAALIPLITGVANATAFAGKGAQEFSRIMYNLNQSYAHGSLQLADWRSIELAGAASKQLKEELIKAAEELEVIEVGAVNMSNFNETLQEGWANTRVLELAFGRFAAASSEAYNLVNKGVVDTASEAYALLETRMDGFSIKAAKSAQEAKTFGEAISATQDAVSSGWMATYEIIFGNYEEAKVLWTDLANTLWDTFASGADARNEMLSDWVSYGGKTSALKALSNIWSTFNKVLSDVKESFHDIFGTMNGLKLSRITQQFEKFTAKLAETVTENDYLKRTFKGLFSLLDIGKITISSFVKLIASFAKGIKPISGNILEIAASFGDWLVALRDSIKQGQGFTSFLNTLNNAVYHAGQFFSNILTNVNSAFVGFIALFRKNADNLSNERTGLEAISEAFNKQIEFFKGLGESVKYIFSVIIEAIGAGFTSLKDAVVNYLSNFKLADLKNVGIVGVLSTFVAYLTTFIKASKQGFMHLKFVFGQSEIAKEIGSFFKNLGGTFKNVKQAFQIVSESLASTLDVLKDSMVAWQSQIRAEVLMSIAKAIGIFTLSVIGLSAIDPTKLKNALSGLAVLLTESIGAMGIIGKLGATNIKTLLTLGPAISELAGAMILMSFAVKSLSGLNAEELQHGLIGLAGMLFGVLTAIKMFGDAKSAISGAAFGILAFSVAANILAAAVKELGASIDKAALDQGLTAVSALIIELGAFLKFVNGSEFGVGTALAIVLLSAAMVILAQACKALTAIPSQMLYDTLGAVALILSAMAFLSKIMGDKSLLSLFSKTPITLSTGLGLIALAAAIAILAKACVQLSAVPMDALFNAELAMAALFTMTGLFSTIMQDTKGMLTSAIALTIISGALYSFSESIAKLAVFKPEQVIQSVLGMGAILGEVAILLSVIPKGALGSAIALAAVGGALYVAIQPFMQLATLSIEQVSVAVAALTAVLVELGIFMALPFNWGQGLKNASVIGLMVVSLIGIAASLKLIEGAFGSDLAKVGVALAAIAGSLIILGTAVALIGSNVKAAGTIAVLASALLMIAPALFLLSSVPMLGLVAGLGALAGAFVIIGVAAAVLAPMAGKIAILAGSILLLGASVAAVGFGVGYFAAELSALGLSIAGAVGSATDFVIALIGMIPEFMTELAKGFFEIIQMFADNAPVVFDAIGKVITGLVDAIVAGIPYLVDSGLKMVVAFLEGIRNNLPQILSVGIEILMVLLNGLNQHIYEITNVVINIITKFVLAVAENIPKIVNAAVVLILSFIRGMRIAVEEHMEEIVNEIFGLGIAICEGLARGIVGGIGHCVTAITNLAGDIWNGICDFFDVNSPSKLMEQLGLYLDSGLEVGIAGGADGPINAMTSLGDGIQTTFAGYASKIPDDGVNMVQSLSTAISSATPDVTGTMGDTMDETVDVVSSSYPDFQKEGNQNIQAMINGMKAQQNSVKVTTASIMQNAVREVANTRPTFYDQGVTLINAFVEGMHSVYREPGDEAYEIVSRAYDIIEGWEDGFYDVGQYIVMGFVEGMRSKIQAAARAAAAIARAAYEAAMDEVDAHSPSRKFYQLGVWIDEGLANGIADYAKYAKTATTHMSADVVDEFTKAVTSISQVADSELDTSPVIRPVVDLAEVWEARDAIDGVLVPAHKLDLLDTIKTGTRISSDLKAIADAKQIQNGSNTPTSTQNFTFNQNNYSPKELSRLDIYRQTKSQFRQFREELVKV